jgi:hypothetical protein
MVIGDGQLDIGGCHFVIVDQHFHIGGLESEYRYRGPEMNYFVFLTI